MTPPNLCMQVDFKWTLSDVFSSFQEDLNLRIRQYHVGDEGNS